MNDKHCVHIYVYVCGNFFVSLICKLTGVKCIVCVKLNSVGSGLTADHRRKKLIEIRRRIYNISNAFELIGKSFGFIIDLVLTLR